MTEIDLRQSVIDEVQNPGPPRSITKDDHYAGHVQVARALKAVACAVLDLADAVREGRDD